MREIQDLVLLRASALADAERAFTVRNEQFLAALQQRLTARPHDNGYLAMRVTALPVSGDIFVERVYRNPAVTPRDGMYAGRFGQSNVRLLLPSFDLAERPILRGTRKEYDHDSYMVAAEVHCSGLVEYRLLNRIDDSAEDMIFPEWVGCLAMNALLTADAMRRAAGAPAVEYGFEVSCVRILKDGFPQLRLGRWGDARTFYGVKEVQPNPLILPRLSFGQREEISMLLDVMYRDLFNAAGMDAGDNHFSVEVPSL